MFNFSNLINNLEYIFSLANSLYTILGFFLAILMKAVYRFAKEHRLKTVLSFKPNLVFDSKRHIICNISTNVIKTNDIKGVHEVLSAKEVIGQNQLVLLLAKINISTTPILLGESSNNNEICIGGSSRAISYLSNYINNFQWNNDKSCYMYGNKQKNVLEFDNKGEYSILIKLTKNILKQDRTVHLLFGASENSTIQAIRFLIERYDYIYRKFKGKHYFIAVRINHADSIINLDNIKDLSSNILTNEHIQ